MADPKIKGEGLILFVYDENGSAYRPVACLTSNSLNQTRNIIESQTKCEPGVTTKTAGTANYTITAEGEYIDTTSDGGAVTKASHDYLMATFMNTGDLFTWKMGTGLADTTDYYGTAVMTDLSLTADTGDAVTTFSVTLDGSGAIVTVDPNAA